MRHIYGTYGHIGKIQQHGKMHFVVVCVSVVDGCGAGVAIVDGLIFAISHLIETHWPKYSICDDTVKSVLTARSATGCSGLNTAHRPMCMNHATGRDRVGTPNSGMRGKCARHSCRANGMRKRGTGGQYEASAGECVHNFVCTTASSLMLFNENAVIR